MFVNGQWGTVCDDGWDNSDAHVICRQLGYLSTRTQYCCAQFGQGTGPMLQLGCQGSEESFHECSQVVSPSGCYHREDAGVECYNDTGMYYSLTLLHVHAYLHSWHCMSHGYIVLMHIALSISYVCKKLNSLHYPMQSFLHSNKCEYSFGRWNQVN